VFSGAEIAVLALRRTRLHHLVEERRSGARAAAALRRQPERFLATVQIGITVVGATAAAFGGATLATPIGRALHHLGLSQPLAQDIGFALIIAFISYLSLVLGELVPKSLALKYSERYALLMAPALAGLGTLLRPLVWFLTGSSNVILRWFGDRTSFAEARISPDELQQMVEEATRAGTIDPQVGDIVSRAFDFSDLRVGAVMLPRARIIAAGKRATVDELMALIAEHGHSRVPIHGDSLDDLLGYVVAKDVVLWSREPQLFVLADLLRPAYTVGEKERAAVVLRELQRRRNQLALVKDELGTVAGLVTIEDLLEELVGEIVAEHEPAPRPLALAADHTVIVPGTTPIRELNRQLGLALPEGEDYTTIAGLCMALAGRLPPLGGLVKTEDGTILEIVATSPGRLDAVRLTAPRRSSVRTDD
jgi:putative hemolysin